MSVVRDAASFAACIPEAARGAFRDLADAIAAMGHEPACTAAPERFWPASRKEPVDEWVRWCCGRCACRVECRRYAEIAGELRHGGVWAGQRAG